MSLFVEDPAHFSKSRLKADLVAHNVALPPAKSKKEVYVELHLKHIHQKNAADFSSDEDEDEVQNVADMEEDAEIPDPILLTDDDLRAMLLKHGFNAGPIVATTRTLYEKKLRKLLQSDGQDHLNGAEEGVLYSDNEAEEEDGEEEDVDSGSEGAKEETAEQSDEAQQESSQVEFRFQNGGFVYPQCFLPSSRLRAHASRNREPSPKWNSGNAVKSSEQSRPHCSQIPVGISRASPVDRRSGLGSGMECRRSLSTSTDTVRELNGSNVQEHWSWSNRLEMAVVDKTTTKDQSLYYTPKASAHKWGIKLSQEPVKDAFKDIIPDTDASPTGIYATRRRPIKGAAERPVQYADPDTPASPTTLERREVERRLVPIHIQILVFLFVACLLYLIYVCVEDNAFSPFVALLDSLNQGSDSEEGLFLQDGSQDTWALSGQE